MRELVDEVVACVDECVSLGAVAAMASRSMRCRGDGVQGDRKKKTPLRTVEERRRPVLLGGVLGDHGRDALDGASQQHEAECHVVF